MEENNPAVITYTAGSSEKVNASVVDVSTIK